MTGVQTCALPILECVCVCVCVCVYTLLCKPSHLVSLLFPHGLSFHPGLSPLWEPEEEQEPVLSESLIIKQEFCVLLIGSGAPILFMYALMCFYPRS